MNDRRPIGVLDSGIGGLTVVRALRRVLPRENFIYIGDTARIPYGTRNPAVLERFGRELVEFLLRHDVKAIVVACNTLSTTVFKALRQQVDVPMFSAIEPVIEELSALPISHKIAVFGTSCTTQSGAYAKALNGHDVFEIACPMLVPFVEEGRVKDDLVAELVKEYAQKAPERGLGAVVLACTHYPVLTPLFRKNFSPRVRFFDSAMPVAQAVRRAIEKQAVLGSDQRLGTLRCYFTDLPLRSEPVVERFLGEPLVGVKKVELSPIIRQVKAGDYTLSEHYWDAGPKATPLVIWHGWGSGGNRWQTLGQRLHELGYSVHALDLPGFGRSPEPPPSWGVPEYTKLMIGYLKEVVSPDGRPAILMGHSFGGQLAIEVAASGQAEIKALILVAAAGLRRPPSKRARVSNAIAKMGRPLRHIFKLLGLETPMLKLVSRLSGNHDYANATPLMRQVLKKVTCYSSEPALKSVKKPVLLLWAQDDAVTPLADGRRLLALLHNAKLETLPQGGHSFYKFYSTQVANFISQFLEKYV